MNLRPLALIVCFSASLSIAQAPAPPASHTAPQPWKAIPIPPLHAFKPVEPTKILLSNGVTLFLEEDHELPFISGFVRIRGGSRDEPADKVGLVSLYGDTWRTSGSAQANRSQPQTIHIRVLEIGRLPNCLSLAMKRPRSPLASGSHFGHSVFDGLLGNAVCDESLAELLDGAVLAPLRFPLGQMLAESIRDVGTDEGLVATEAERRGDLLEILDDVIG